MKAFHNDPAIKQKFIDRVKNHQEIYKKRSSVVCTLEIDSNEKDHSIYIEYEKQLGIPSVLARLKHIIHKRLLLERARSWPVEFLSAIEVGADLSDVWPQFGIWILGNEKHGVINFVKLPEYKSVIQKVIDLYSATLNPNWRRMKEWASSDLTSDDYSIYAADYSTYPFYTDDFYDYCIYASTSYYSAASADCNFYGIDEKSSRIKIQIEYANKLLELLREARPIEMGYENHD